MRDEVTWVWEETDPDRSGSSGDIAKLFKNEGVKNPGIFAADAPSDHATLMAREVIQNSADAAAEFIEEFGDDVPDFTVEFEFEALEGEERESFAEAIDLRSIAARGTDPSDPGWRARLGLDPSAALDHLDDGSPLRTLKIVEHGTTGMYGPFEGAKSKMYLALISLGYTAKMEGAGGSYGYGKAGLIRGSAIRTVVAYTSFQEQPDDPGVTRRLLGMTYWGQHELDGVSYTGFARFGARQAGGAVRPFENEEADEMAEQLGLELRAPGDLDETGTTFLLIDPTVSPDDLNRAIARNWWPALEDGRLTASVIDEGRILIPRPMKDPVLRSFVDAYHLATTDQDNQKPNQERVVLERIPLGARKLKTGGLGLVADPGGWSYDADPDEGEEEAAPRSLVALVRGPRMVVEYLDAGGARPFVRGTFVADDDIDELLRQTEPKAHDSWQTRLDEPGIDPAAPEVARSVLRRIRNNVRRFRDRLKPAARPAEDIRLPELERLFSRFFTAAGSTPVGPDPVPRPFSIHLEQRVEPVGVGQVRFVGRAGFALAHDSEMDEAEVDVQISYRFVEDGGIGEESVLAVDVGKGFELISEAPYRYRGILTRDRVSFEVSSPAYPSDWTGRFKADVEPVGEGSQA